LNADKLVLGTSGWSYKEWIGPFYSKEDKSMLNAYSKVFKTVEIDSTFYRYPSKGMVMGWTRYSPEGFVFTAKLPKLITHTKKLNLNQGIEHDLNNFLELMEPLSLSGKLGCILIQLPPKFSFNPEQLEGFFKLLPSHVKFAVEFRNLSWMKPETWHLLEKYKVAYTIVDEPLLPPEVHVTSDFAYFRWHGRGSRIWFDYEYSAEELEPWVPKVKAAAEKVEKVFGYFNNHYRGNAVKNCLQIMDVLETLTKTQTEAKNRIESYMQKLKLMSPTASTLETFVEPAEKSFDKLLRFFVDAPRLRKAAAIKKNEVAITKQTDQRIEARVRDYHIVIDFVAKEILHDCADWERVSANQKLCKHIGRLLLSLDEKTASKILGELYNNTEEWKFKHYGE
jgi:uncharacterized protein YecE (DUF72 family)